MFAPHCPQHGRRVLLGDDEITGIRNDTTGITVSWRCPCGFDGTTHYASRRRPGPRA